MINEFKELTTEQATDNFINNFKRFIDKPTLVKLEFVFVSFQLLYIETELYLETPPVKEQFKLMNDMKLKDYTSIKEDVSIIEYLNISERDYNTLKDTVNILEIFKKALNNSEDITSDKIYIASELFLQNVIIGGCKNE